MWRLPDDDTIKKIEILLIRLTTFVLLFLLLVKIIMEEVSRALAPAVP